MKRNPVSLLLSPAPGPCSSSPAPGPCSSLHQPLGPAPPHQPLGPAPLSTSPGLCSSHQPLGPTHLISPLLLTRPDIPPCLPNAAVTLPNAAGAPRALLVRGVREAQRTPHRTPHPPRNPWDTPWDPLAVTLCTRGPSEHTPWDPLVHHGTTLGPTADRYICLLGLVTSAMGPPPRPPSEHPHPPPESPQPPRDPLLAATSARLASRLPP